MKIQLHAKRDGITKLGPGTRFVVWTQLSGMYDSGKSADEWWFFRRYETAGRGDFTVRQTWTDNQRRRAVFTGESTGRLNSGSSKENRSGRDDLHRIYP